MFDLFEISFINTINWKISKGPPDLIIALLWIDALAAATGIPLSAR
jgi:hypothetical protein